MAEGYLFGTGPAPQPNDPLAGNNYGQMIDKSKLVNPAWAAADTRSLQSVPMGSTPGWPIGADAQGSLALMGGSNPVAPPSAAAAVSSPPRPNDRSFEDSNFQWQPPDFGVRQQAGLNPAQQGTAAEVSQPNETINYGSGPTPQNNLSVTEFRGKGANGGQGLRGADWAASQGGDITSPSTGGYIGQHDPAPHEGNYSFSGNGTGADYIGQDQARTVFNARDAQIRQSEDPYEEQRLKGDYAVQAAQIPAMIRAQGDQNVAHIQGQNQITKEEAQYASYDQLVDQQLEQQLQQALQQAQGSGHPQWQQAFQRRAMELLQAAQGQKKKIREFGVGGRPNPLEALYGGLGTPQAPQPNPAQ